MSYSMKKLELTLRKFNPHRHRQKILAIGLVIGKKRHNGSAELSEAAI